jgi:arginine decarboxylase
VFELTDRFLVDEKTGFYSFLILFSIGVTKGQSSVLLSSMLEFKKRYDRGEILDDVMPQIVKKYPHR